MRIVLLLAALLAMSCSRAPDPVPQERYPLTGEVISVDPKTQTALIKHEEIKGWMDAMTMEFPIKEKAEFEKLKPGDRITGTVFVHDLDYRLGEIQVRRTE
jgi:protein SCO1/2